MYILIKIIGENIPINLPKYAVVLIVCLCHKSTMTFRIYSPIPVWLLNKYQTSRQPFIHSVSSAGRTDGDWYGCAENWKSGWTVF